MAYFNNKPVAFVSITIFRNKFSYEMYKISRVVIIPDFQKLNITSKLLREIIESEYKNKDVRITTALDSMQSNLNRNEDFILKAQYLNNIDYGNGTVTRKCYLETYQYKNEAVKNYKITRVGIKKENFKYNKNLLS